jgi:spore germination cell wall hydrolase CwlJ-like protein
MGFLYQKKIEDHIKEGNMKKILICFALMFFFSFPLGSANTNNDKSVMKHGQLTIENVAIPNYSSLNFVLENRAKQVECLAKNIYFEARNEPFAGQLAVALVTLNRVYDDTFPNTVCDVVYQGIHTTDGFPKRDRCQFSWYCDGASDEIRNLVAFNTTQKIANLAMLQYSKLKSEGLDYTEGAIYYHTHEIKPRWSTAYPKVGRIGDHIFYR